MNRLITLHEMRLLPSEVADRIHEMRDIEASAKRSREESLALLYTVRTSQEDLRAAWATHQSVKRNYEAKLADIERREAALARAEIALAAREAAVQSAEAMLRSHPHWGRLDYLMRIQKTRPPIE